MRNKILFVALFFFLLAAIGAVGYIYVTVASSDICPECDLPEWYEWNTEPEMPEGDGTEDEYSIRAKQGTRQVYLTIRIASFLLFAASLVLGTVAYTAHRMKKRERFFQD